MNCTNNSYRLEKFYKTFYKTFVQWFEKECKLKNNIYRMGRVMRVQKDEFLI